jgi:hypothetical protein
MKENPFKRSEIPSNEGKFYQKEETPLQMKQKPNTGLHFMEHNSRDWVWTKVFPF